jgi:UDP-N-acetylglucosamine transferase subunit ALG13
MNSAYDSTGPRVLVAPLDWGLGHATRCIPLIRTLIYKKCSVFLAGEGKVKALLTKEFPDLPFLPLSGYNIQYARNRRLLPFVLALQMPRLLSAINKEHQWLREKTKELELDAVISDNRYGLYHPGIFSVILTHQLRIAAPYAWAEKILREKNYRFLNRFQEVWVPDVEKAPGLSGTLGHPKQLPSVPLRYTGCLSRFHLPVESQVPAGLLVLLSGPEPQRTILEDLIIKQLTGYNGSVTIVRGLPGNSDRPTVPKNFRVFNHLAQEELQEAILQAEVVVSRSGYSTVMDLATLRKKSILIPTPGQTEQEYLGAMLHELQMAVMVRQDKLRLMEQLAQAASMVPAWPASGTGMELEHCVDRLMEKTGAGSPKPAGT